MIKPTSHLSLEDSMHELLDDVEFALSRLREDTFADRQTAAVLRPIAGRLRFALSNLEEPCHPSPCG